MVRCLTQTAQTAQLRGVIHYAYDSNTRTKHGSRAKRGSVPKFSRLFRDFGPEVPAYA